MEKLLEKLASLSIDNLLAVIAEAEKQLRDKQKEEQAKAKAEIAELARKAGIAVSFGGGATQGEARKRAPARPKYANPLTGETWTGKGHKPRWVQEALGQGATLESLLIK